MVRLPVVASPLVIWSKAKGPVNLMCNEGVSLISYSMIYSTTILHTHGWSWLEPRRVGGVLSEKPGKVLPDSSVIAASDT